jgi:leucine dehydrogenase
VPPGDAIGTDCDVYAPCALGGTLAADSIPRLHCRVVAGCANNQLATTEDSERLRDAGILYAPDFVINAGGVLYAWGTESLGWDPDTVETRLAGIGQTLAEIYVRAEADGVGTHAAAEDLARSRSSREARWSA